MVHSANQQKTHHSVEVGGQRRETQYLLPPSGCLTLCRKDGEGKYNTKNCSLISLCMSQTLPPAQMQQNVTGSWLEEWG